jgi:hypothetical protein
MEKNRAVVDGIPMNFTCSNRRFCTDLAKGFPHGEEAALGSVFKIPLVDHGSNTLWLEHVVSLGAPAEEWYWFMWYEDGIPKIPLSGVFTKSDLSRMMALIGTFVP